MATCNILELLYLLKHSRQDKANVRLLSKRKNHKKNPIVQKTFFAGRPPVKKQKFTNQENQAQMLNLLIPRAKQEKYFFQG